jgi:hypothetical protein
MRKVRSPKTSTSAIWRRVAGQRPARKLRAVTER